MRRSRNSPASPPALDRSPRLDRPAWAFALAALLALVTAAVFANALNGLFLFDDIGDITANPSAHAATFFERLRLMNRPLTKASYAAQDALHGLNAAAFHGVNVALHVAAVVLAFLLLRRAARLSLPDGALATGLAFCVAAVWAVHPALTDTVTYVSGRSMGLSALLILAMLLGAGAAPSRLNAVFVFLCALAAPLARETALIAPAILAWWLLTVQPPESTGRFWRRLAPALVGAAVAAVLIFASSRHTDLVAYSLRHKPPLEALRGNVHAAFDILAYWATPLKVTIDPAPPLGWPWDDARTLAKLAFIAALAMAALVERRRRPLIAFGLGLALLALAPSNTLLWRADPVSLKPLYLGGLGLTLAAGAVLTLALSTRGGRRTFAATAMLVAAVLAAATIQRNALFADETALWRDATLKTPDYGRPWVMLGYALFNEGLYDEAEAALRRGTDLDPLDARAAEVLALVEKIRAGHAADP